MKQSYNIFYYLISKIEKFNYKIQTHCNTSNGR